LLNSYLSTEESAPLVAWYYTPMARAFTFDHDFPVVVYDCMDELSAFRGAPKGLRVMEQDLLACADVVFTGGRALYEAKKPFHPNVHAFPSSVDVSHFLPARAPNAEACPLQGLRHPRLGYVGVIDERIDYDLIEKLADLRPDWEIVMIGPVVKVDPASLPRRSNIHWLGSRPYADIPDYLRALDIGFMPFAMNEATAYISPTKTPEYLAAGLHVVSTPVTDVVRTWGGPQGVVEIVRDAPSAAAACQRCLESGTQARWLQRVDALLAETSWDKTWSAMRRQIALAARRPSSGLAAVDAHV
jgi:UDP-galactopyranose mutase